MFQPMLAFFGFPSHWEMLVVLLVVLLLFGTRLPSVMRSLGKGVVEFKKGLNDIGSDEEEEQVAQDGQKKEKEKVTQES